MAQQMNEGFFATQPLEAQGLKTAKIEPETTADEGSINVVYKVPTPKSTKRPEEEAAKKMKLLLKNT